MVHVEESVKPDKNTYGGIRALTLSIRTEIELTHHIVCEKATCR